MKTYPSLFLICIFNTRTITKVTIFLCHFVHGLSIFLATSLENQPNMMEDSSPQPVFGWKEKTKQEIWKTSLKLRMTMLSPKMHMNPLPMVNKRLINTCHTKEENIVDISCIDTIFHGEISIRQNFERNLQKSTISRDISTILEINHQFFQIYHMVNAG